MKRNISGKVVKGLGEGKALGYPTANIAVRKKFRKRDFGVYACRVRFLRHERFGVLHIGPVAIFGVSSARCEVHILDWKKNINGRHLRITIEKKIRNTKKFSSVKKLRSSILRDVKMAKAYFQRQ